MNQNISIDQALQLGIDAHKSGELEKADRYYTAILKVNPNHPDANHNMGVLATNLGQTEKAVPFFKKAIKCNPSISQYWLSLCEAFLTLKNFTELAELLENTKSAGIKGSVFEKLEHKLSQIAKKNITKPTNPPAEVTDSLLKLYELEKFPQTLNEVNNLLAEFPSSALLFNIAGATNVKLNQFNEAIASYKQAVKVDPNYANAYNNLGIVQRNTGDLKASIESFKQAVRINPNYADAYYNMGNTYQATGEKISAIKYYKLAIDINPGHIEAYVGLGNIYGAAGENIKAAAIYKEAIELKPDHQTAINNLGSVLIEIGDLQGAKNCFNKAISINPKYADAFYNMALASQKEGKTENAIKFYNKAIEVNPEYLHAHNNLGNIFKNSGNFDEAFGHYINAIKISPDFSYANVNIGLILEELKFEASNKEIGKVLDYLLTENFLIRPSTISRAIIKILKLDINFTKLFELIYHDAGNASCQSVILELSKCPLLLKFMSICPIPDLEIEALFREIRKKILLSIECFADRESYAIFQSALALQCFTNEYIYNVDETERNGITELQGRVEKTLMSGNQPDPTIILCLASYKALNEYGWSKNMICVNETKQVIKRQLVEPEIEYFLKSEIPNVKEINDEVSAEVRQQYEFSPYPRWVNLRLSLEPETISGIFSELKLRLWNTSISKIESPKVLIAGCGTGQHSIETASLFKDASVLAIDLSLSSLAYARRKTEELKIENIEYIQADILDLKTLNRKFDIIESVGVLHHMKDPLEGWKILTECLNNGGLMRIGLYSNVARKHISKIREEISLAGINATPKDIRAFREKIVKSDEIEHKKIQAFNDFYSLSDLRDLLFHVQEHRFTIPQIKDSISKLGLKFCGFCNPEIVKNFQKSYNNQNDLYDLQKWHLYEQSNQDAFIGMYEFWCQKIERFKKKHPMKSIDIKKSKIDIQETNSPSQQSIKNLVKLNLLKDFNQSINDAEELIKKFPNTFILFNIIGDAYTGMKKLDAAMKAYKTSLKIEKKQPEVLYNVANIHRIKGMLKSAKEKYKQAIEINPNYVDAYNNLGIVLRELGELDTATATYKRVLKIKPDHADALFNLGNIYKEKHQLGKAIDYYSRAIRANPKHAAAYNNLGNIQKQKGDISGAINSFNKAIKFNPQLSAAYNNRGNAERDKNDISAATKSYKKAIEINENFADAYINLANILRDTGKISPAIEYYQHSMKINPNCPETYNNMGIAFKYIADFQNAIAYFKKALSVKPDFADAQHNLNSMLGITSKTAPKIYIENLFDNYARSFDASLITELEYSAPKLLVEVLQPYVKKKQFENVLDIGCGTGLTGAKLRQSSINLTGIDLSKKMLEIAEKKQIYDVLQHISLQEFIPQSKKKYNLIISADVFIYVGDLYDTFKGIKRILKNNGLFAFTTENLDGEGFQLEKSGRFSHSQNYIYNLCKEFNFHTIYFENKNLRKENGKWISGGYYLVRQ